MRTSLIIDLAERNTVLNGIVEEIFKLEMRIELFQLKLTYVIEFCCRLIYVSSPLLASLERESRLAHSTSV